jgi:aminopeptidase YwaD
MHVTHRLDPHQRASSYLHYLCSELSTRQTGSPDNQAATDFFASNIKRFGFEVEKSYFDCLAWNPGDVSLVVSGKQVEAFISPYSLGVEVDAPLIHVSNLEQLQAAEMEGKVALLTGGLAREQIMPKHFPFYNPEQHQRIISIIEEKKPLALIAATGKDPQLAGGVYPFPLFEDGDFDIPSVYIKDKDGTDLAVLKNPSVSLRIEAERIPSKGCNVIGRKGNLASPRLIFCAHIDSKPDTPGALDNAAGIATLLLLAEQLQYYTDGIPLEILAFNGEDYYAASGELEYLRTSLGAPKDVLLAINVDGAGYSKGHTAYSLYGVPDDQAQLIHATLSAYPELIEGQQWYQSDHSLFIQQGIPCMAFTSDQFDMLWSEIAHTRADRPEIVSVEKLVTLSDAFIEMVSTINHHIHFNHD